MPSSSSRSVVTIATRLPRTTRTRSSASRLTTFWWIAAFAKRVSAAFRAMTLASPSSLSTAFSAASQIRLSSRSPIVSPLNCSISPSVRRAQGWRTRSSRQSRSSLDSTHHPDPHVTEARRRRAVAGVADLAGLTLAAVRRAPHRPLRLRAYRVRAAPELGGDAGVRGAAQRPRALPVLDLPPDLRAELEVQPPVVDRPRAVRVHVDAVVGVGDQVLERPRAA